MNWAADNNKSTIEMTSGGQWLQEMDLYGENSPVKEVEADHLWRAASAQFSRSASGVVNAFTEGTTFDINKVFYGLELKNLAKNPEVQFPIIYRGNNDVELDK